MKLFLPLLITVVIAACGNNSANLADQKKIQDSIAAAKLDSIKFAELQKQYTAVDSSKYELQKSFDLVLTRLDSLTSYNNELEEKLMDRTNDISKLKDQIIVILKKQNLSEPDKAKAHSLIDELNKRVDDFIKKTTK